MNGKLSLEVGTPMYVPCHNDLTKKYCDNCMGCIDPACNRNKCDAHGNCQCTHTQCICIGRNT